MISALDVTVPGDDATTVPLTISNNHGLARDCRQCPLGELPAF
jgi:hypothetical protein